MRKLSCAIILGLVFLAAPVAAEVVPHPRAGDDRVRFVVYDEDEVVRLVGHYGFITFVDFGQHERIVDVALGDSAAWEVAPSSSETQLFLKPGAPDARTNLTVVTSRRVYHFDLHSEDEAEGPQIYEVRYRYLDEELAQAERERERNRERSNRARSYNYTAAGTDMLRPVEAYDDGVFTYFRFSPGLPVPAIYGVEPDGSESLMNWHAEGDFIAVHGVRPQFVMRRGQAVLCVYNERLPTPESARPPVREAGWSTAGNAELGG